MPLRDLQPKRWLPDVISAYFLYTSQPDGILDRLIKELVERLAQKCLSETSNLTEKAAEKLIGPARLLLLAITSDDEHALSPLHQKLFGPEAGIPMLPLMRGILQFAKAHPIGQEGSLLLPSVEIGMTIARDMCAKRIDELIGRLEGYTEDSLTDREHEMLHELQCVVAHAPDVFAVDWRKGPIAVEEPVVAHRLRKQHQRLKLLQRIAVARKKLDEVLAKGESIKEIEEAKRQVVCVRK